jgi:hypothetical protein
MAGLVKTVMTNSTKFMSLCIILAAVSLPCLGYADDLYAIARPAPISGTPLLRHQKLQLLGDIGKMATIRARKDILNNGDFVGRVISFWAFNFGTSAYYQTTATCKRLATLSTGYKLNIYVENGQLSNPNIADAIFDNIQAYSYAGKLGSLVLDITGIRDTLGMEGIQLGSSSPSPRVKADSGASNTISTSGRVSTSGSGGRGCFIATVAYGSPLAQEVVILREFRDRYLMTNLPGRALVSFYYAWIPMLAVFISEHESLKTVTRVTLYPTVTMSRTIMRNPGETGLFTLCLFFFVWILIRRKRG